MRSVICLASLWMMKSQFKQKVALPPLAELGSGACDMIATLARQQPAGRTGVNFLLRNDLSLEFLLVASTCEWPKSTERDQKLRELAAKGANWELVLDLAVRHRVE